MYKLINTFYLSKIEAKISNMTMSQDTETFTKPNQMAIS